MRLFTETVILVGAGLKPNPTEFQVISFETTNGISDLEKYQLFFRNYFRKIYANINP